jgi:hypothetical protein
MTDDLSAAIESEYHPSSANTAMCVADSSTPSIYNIKGLVAHMH